MTGSGGDLLFILPLARVHSLCVSNSGTNAGTSHFFGPKRIPIDPPFLVDACGLAAEGERTWLGQAVKGILDQRFGTAGRNWTVHSHSGHHPTTIDPVEDKRRMGVRTLAGRCSEYTSVGRQIAFVFLALDLDRITGRSSTSTSLRLL